MSWKPEEPYKNLPLLLPAIEPETKAVLKCCTAARAALAGLKQAAELIPNQTMLINTLPLMEARDSSEIENIVTTTDKLFQFADSDDAHADYAVKEALRYRGALYEGWQTLSQRPIKTNRAETSGSQITGVELTVRKVPGTALANDKTGQVNLHATRR